MPYLFAALLNGATIALFQGSPLGRPFGEFVQRARVSQLGLVPSIAKAWRASGCMAGLDWSCLRCYRSGFRGSHPRLAFRLHNSAHLNFLVGSFI